MNTNASLFWDLYCLQHTPVNPVFVEEAKADIICGAKNDSLSK